MAVFSPLTSRRSTRRKGADATQQLIVFRLRNEGFALPIMAVQKVIPMGNIYGAPGGAGVSLTLYQDQELIVIDVGCRIFREAPRLNSEPSIESQSSALVLDDKTLQRYLLIVQGARGGLGGGPRAGPPAGRRGPAAAGAPRP